MNPAEDTANPIEPEFFTQLVCKYDPGSWYDHRNARVRWGEVVLS